MSEAKALALVIDDSSQRFGEIAEVEGRETESDLIWVKFVDGTTQTFVAGRINFVAPQVLVFDGRQAARVLKKREEALRAKELFKVQRGIINNEDLPRMLREPFRKRLLAWAESDGKLLPCKRMYLSPGGSLDEGQQKPPDP